MSGLKPPELNQFYAKLAARGLDTTDIAAAVGRSRTAVCKVLNGSTRRGPLWKRIERLLMPSEIALLDVAHRSPWNTQRIAKRPRWTPAKAAVLAGYHANLDGPAEPVGLSMKA